MNIPSARLDFPEEDRKEISRKIDEVLKSGMLTLGKYTKEFEEKFREYAGTDYAVAVGSGTAALEICLRASGIKNSSVIVPTNTFCATPAAVIHACCRVIFADIGDDLCLDPDSLQSSIKKDTKAVILVHIAGNITKNINAIRDVCEDKGIFLIEDAAHAAGSGIRGRENKKAGNLGECAAFSFYPTKVMTSGEGGMITTNSKEICKKAIVLRDQGKESFNSNNIVEIGYNWRMSEISAIIGLQQLKRLDEFIGKRKEIAGVYDGLLKKTEGIRPLAVPGNADPNYYKYVAFIDEKIDRSGLKKSLKEKFNVSLSGEVYDVPCHMQPVFRNMFRNEYIRKLPESERLCKSHICLPIYPDMKKEEAEYVADSLINAGGFA